MSTQTLINVRSLEELIALAAPACLRRFMGLAECEAACGARQWPSDDQLIADAVLQALHESSQLSTQPAAQETQRGLLAAADREALRIYRLSSLRGAQILMSVAEQLNDNALLAQFMQQNGGQIGRAIWMRTHSPATCRVFEIAETLLLAGDISGSHRLYDVYEIPGDSAPPFVWTAQIKVRLEEALMHAMRLDGRPEVAHIEVFDTCSTGLPSRLHCLVVRFTGMQWGAVEDTAQTQNGLSCYSTRDATLIYAPQRMAVEVYVQNIALRAAMANALAFHGFASPLSQRPLNRARYDLSAFTRPLKHVRPKLDVGKVERLYLLEAKALLGHASDTVRIEMSSGAELHDVIASRWSQHPFVAPEMLLRVTLAADVVFDGEITETPLAITVAKPGLCSLQCERDPRIRQAGEQLLEKLGVCRRQLPGETPATPSVLQVMCKLMELTDSVVDGFALRDMGVDIEFFASEGHLVECGRITERRVECAPQQEFNVQLVRCADGVHVRYHDPLSGVDVLEPAHLARTWSVNAQWLSQELLSALGSQLTGIKRLHDKGIPVFLGEVTIDTQAVPIYFAPRMGTEQAYRVVDLALRLQPRLVPGIVLTTAARPFPFAGTNVVVSIEDVLSAGDGHISISVEALSVAYRAGKLAARGGASVSLQVSADQQSGVLHIPGKPAWPITGKMKITVLQRLVQAYACGPGHLVTKVLLAGTGCDSLDGLFGIDSRWREYVEKVQGTRAWRLATESSTAGHRSELDTGEAGLAAPTLVNS